MGEHKRNRASRRLTVAVCIPTIRGREEDLMRATLSVMEQERQPDQLIVELDENRTGAAATRNRMIAKVETDVIAWLDDDDHFGPSHLRACMRVMEQSPFHPDLVFPVPKMLNGRDPTAVTHAAHIRNVGSYIPITHLVRTEIVRKIGGFPEGETLPDGRYRGEDEAYLIKLLDAGAVFEHLDKSTWFWRTNPKSTAGRGDGVNHVYT
jgi:glycosyltransferase involved in cell wall biosynthesis